MEDIINETVEKRVKEAYAAGQQAAFVAAVEECELFMLNARDAANVLAALNEQLSEKLRYGESVAQKIADRITQRAKRNA